jgi:hypothetical protein
MVAVFSTLFAIVAPGAAHAQDVQNKLALLPLDQAGSYFDLSMQPGETRSIEVEISNNGDAAIAARTYAADVYTIINGGFGGRLRDEPKSGMTLWLAYPTDVLQLPAGKSIRRSFTVAVPAETGPGEYITSLVLENDQPIEGGGAVTLTQIVRQAIGVVVTVPGQRSPGFAIGEASHTVVVGKSVVTVAVENTGNVRLKPAATFTLLDEAGSQVSQTSVPMDTFYAHTSTTVEVPLAALLLPGTYMVRLTLDDAAQGIRADKAAIPLVVEAASEAAAVGGVVPGLTEVIQNVGGGRIWLPVWVVILLASLIIGGIVIGLLVVVMRRGHRTGTSEQ